MSSRKVTVELKVRLVMNVNEGQNVIEVLEGMDYNFLSGNENAEIVDTEIHDWEVTTTEEVQ